MCDDIVARALLEASLELCSLARQLVVGEALDLRLQCVNLLDQWSYPLQILLGRIAQQVLDQT